MTAFLFARPTSNSLSLSHRISHELIPFHVPTPPRSSSLAFCPGQKEPESERENSARAVERKCLFKPRKSEPAGLCSRSPTHGTWRTVPHAVARGFFRCRPSSPFRHFEPSGAHFPAEEEGEGETFLVVESPPQPRGRGTNTMLEGLSPLPLLWTLGSIRAERLLREES